MTSMTIAMNAFARLIPPLAIAAALVASPAARAQASAPIDAEKQQLIGVER